MYTYSASFMKSLLDKEEAKAFFTKKYPSLVANYLLLVRKIGPNCPNALLLLKTLWVFEENENKDKWQERLKNNDWQ